MTPSHAPEDHSSPNPQHTLSPWACRGIGFLLALHCMAIIVGPWSVPPSSLLSQEVFQVFEPYVEAAFLNHGYHFFAPDPGPSHLIRYEVVRADGSEVKGYFPDREQNWPRLAYHRHFMMSEHLNGFLEGGQKELADSHIASYARHLNKTHGGTEVRMFLVRHDLPSPDQVMEGMKLDDPSLYREKSLGSFQAL